MRPQRIVLVALLAFSICAALAGWTGVSAGNPPIPGASYSGTMVDATGACDDGHITVGEDFTLRVSDYGSIITTIDVTGVTFDAFFTSPITYTLVANIPVAADGSFSQTLHPVADVAVFVQGVFEGAGVSGTSRITLSGAVECEATFTATSASLPQGETVFGESIEERDGCGGGEISITRSADRLSVLAISVEEFDTGQSLASGSSRFDPRTVPVSPSSGSFSAYFPGRDPGQEIAVSGTFASGNVSGAIEVSPSLCGPRPYSAGIPSGDGSAVGGVPNTGAPTGYKSELPELALVLGLLGAATVSFGFILRKS